MSQKIFNMSLWLENRLGDACATSQLHRQ